MTTPIPYLRHSIQLRPHYYQLCQFITFPYSILVSISRPKALYHLDSDNIFRITVVVADWLGLKSISP